MFHIDVSRPDRDVGSTLSGAEVERLREALNWVRKNRGVRLTEIAAGCDVPEHTVRNFAYRKSNRPDNAFLGRLCKYFAEDREILPESFFLDPRETRPQTPRDLLGRLAQFDLIRLELPITEDDLKRVFDRYSGYYLCFRRSYRPARMSVSWLHIRPLSPSLDITREGLPLPRFTLFIEYHDRFDPDMTRSYIIVGYTISRNGHLFFIGHHDGELQYLTLNEPSIRKFNYLQGLCLLTSTGDRQPFSTRLVCQYLGREASRPAWEEKIGVFPDDDFDSLFDNADVVKRALGDEGVLVASKPE
ncbi:MAG: hypothetical protein ACE5LF_02975 [Alphaproteobacteria bacterium]